MNLYRVETQFGQLEFYGARVFTDFTCYSVALFQNVAFTHHMICESPIGSHRVIVRPEFQRFALILGYNEVAVQRNCKLAKFMQFVPVGIFGFFLKGLSSLVHSRAWPLGPPPKSITC